MFFILGLILIMISGWILGEAKQSKSKVEFIIGCGIAAIGSFIVGVLR